MSQFTEAQLKDLHYYSGLELQAKIVGDTADNVIDSNGDDHSIFNPNFNNNLGISDHRADQRVVQDGQTIAQQNVIYNSFDDHGGGELFRTSFDQNIAQYIGSGGLTIHEGEDKGRKIQ